MAWWKKKKSEHGGAGESGVDYYEEGVQLMRVGKHHEAVTSFRLALRDDPGDIFVLQQIAIAYTRIGMTEEAAKTYRSVLERDSKAVGAHYGLAFLLLREGKSEDAVDHLRAFLAHPPESEAVSSHIEHARRTLDELTGKPAGGAEA